MVMLGVWARTSASFRRRLSHGTEPHILFPAIAVLGLLAIWGATLNLIVVERDGAERSALISSREQAETYEAQVLRALREIDQTLKLVKYAYELGGEQQLVLEELKNRTLMPPDLLFVVSTADSNGAITASTRATAMPNVAREDYFQSQLASETFSVGRPPWIAGSGDWKLHFSRRLNGPNGSFAGIVMVSVEAAYFVSGYEASKLGEQGVLALLSTDGMFRVRRTGERVFSGAKVDYAAVVSTTEGAQGEGRLSTNPWDGVRRYTCARELYDFPLAVIVGLSADEQLALTRRDRNGYLWRASAVSLLLLVVVFVLGRLSHQLALSRSRAVEEHSAHSARVEYIAYHDALTTLPNRSLFSKLLGLSINQARRYGRQMAVLFLDLDRFKHINDTLGHEAGDQLLKEVATRLRACLRDSDTVARIGGDEFVVLLPELDVEKYAATVAQKVLSSLVQPFVLLGQEFRVTASVGISTFPQDGQDEQTLTKNADVAMYQAKQEGKNNFQFYSEKLHANSLQRLTLESGLRLALERNEFQLHYQPKRDIPSGRITGVEALLRWQHPDLGTVAPMQFIPVAEETGLILPIGRWALRSACLQNVAWQKQGLHDLSVAVNLSVRQFYDEQLMRDLRAILTETGMDARLLELEITESLLMRDVEHTLRVFTGLKELGIRIAIDDFGIGYSSLSALEQFPLDTIKIDRSFIRDVTSAAEGKTLTEAIIAMGRTLSLTVVAQGVETKEQADFLRQNACDQFQGFYLNPPMRGDEIAELLRTESPVADRAQGMTA